MASLHKNDVTDLLAAMGSGMVPPLPEAKHNAIDPAMEPEIQTDKEMVKIVGCRTCGRPLVVTTFYAPAKAICRPCDGTASEGEGRALATVGVPIPGQTDPAKAINLADCLINAHFAMALCPVHPDNEEHVMELKSVSHSPSYGPGEWIDVKGKRVYHQIASGETVMHQCLKCNATVSYSTKQVIQYKRMNEPKIQPDLGPPQDNMLLGVRAA